MIWDKLFQHKRLASWIRFQIQKIRNTQTPPTFPPQLEKVHTTHWQWVRLAFTQNIQRQTIFGRWGSSYLWQPQGGIFKTKAPTRACQRWHNPQLCPSPASFKDKENKRAFSAPLNIQLQNTIDKTGCIIPKDQMTHDQSFKWSPSSTLVICCVTKENLLPCACRGVVRRLEIWTVAAQNEYPKTRFYATKPDFKAAFCCLHLHFSTAIQCCTQPRNEIFINTFGDAPCLF